jgi:hypothetical protein
MNNLNQITWEEALEKVIAKTGHEAYRKLCSSDNPDVKQRDIYRKRIIEKATGIKESIIKKKTSKKIEYPPIYKQVMSFGKTVLDFAASGFEMSSEEETKRRYSICETCEWFAKNDRRCTKCGCSAALKTRILSSHCPLPDPKW